MNYPKCPKCGKSTYLNHSYKHYNRYKCNHIIVNHNNFNIDSASIEAITGSISMKGMRFPLQIIITSLTLYYLNNTSTRAISQFLLNTFNVKVSHVTIANWSNKFAPYFKLKANEFMKEINLHSDDWHAYETVVFINGIKHYLWLVIDFETRFIVSFHLSRYRAESSAFALINEARKYGSPSNIITDRWPAYTETIATLLPCTKHLPVKLMPSDTNNNLIKSFNKTLKLRKDLIRLKKLIT